MLKTRTLIRVVLSSEDSFEHVQFDYKNETFVGVTGRGVVYSGDISTNKISVVYKLRNPSTSLSLFLKDEQTFALIAVQNGSLVSLNIDTKSLADSHPGFGMNMQHISLHQLSDRIVTTFQHSGIIWDISDARLTPLQRLSYPGNAVLLKVFFGPNGDNVISCFADGTVIAWDFPSLEYQTQLPEGGLTGNVEQVAVSWDATVIMSLTSDSKLVTTNLVGNMKPQITDLPHLAQSIMQIDIFTTLGQEYINFPVFLLESGILAFLSLASGKVLMELSAKIGKYVKFAVPSRLIDSSTTLIAAILEDGNLEILSIPIPGKKTSASSKVGLQKSIKSKIQKPKNSYTPPVSTRIHQNEQRTTDKQSVQVEKKRGPTQIIRLYEFENMLDKFGEFPKKYRTVIWRHLLGLPLNRESFSALCAREMHPAYDKIEEKFPVIDSKLLTAFKRILSSIAHWCTLFAEISYLPILIFPFVKVLHENLLTCLEIIMTFLVNWCQDWFQYFPAPPYHVFAKIETILEKSSPLLHSHFKKHGVTSRDYAWPLLESSFSDIFTTDEWLRTWDHIFVSKDPNFVYSLVVAYLSVSENTLLRCTKLEDIQKYVHNRNSVSLKVILKKAKEINVEIAMPIERASRSEIRPFVPLTKGTYPMFSNFPMIVVKSHAYQMQKIRQMEAECIKERKAVLQLEAEYGSLYEQEEAWKRKDAIIRAAGYLQKQEALREEQHLKDQRTRLQILKRQLKMKECALLESKKRQLQREYQHRSEVHVGRLEDTCRWIASLQQAELAESHAESELRYFNQKIDKCEFEIDLLKNDAKVNRNVDERIHRIAGNQFYDKNPLSHISETQSQDPEPTEERSESDVVTDNHAGKSPTRHSLNLEEQLARLEKSNKNIEMELNQMMASLASSHIS